MKILLSVMLCAFFSLSLSRCGSSVSLPATAPGSSIKLSGKLSAASARNLNRDARAKKLRYSTPAEQKRDSVVAGATVLCATLTAPPISASTVTDSDGNFSVTLSASGQPFSCYLSAAGSTATIPLVFASGSSSSAMAVSSTDLIFGSIAVTTNGNGSIVASANLPDTAQLQTTTPPGLSCIAGTWGFTSYYEACGGNATSYQLTFSELPDGSYASAYVKTNGVTNTFNVSGTTTYGSNCIAVNSMDGLAVGEEVNDSSIWTSNPGGAGVIPASIITSLTACGANHVQLSQTANGGSGTVADSYLITVCGTTALNTQNVAYSATDSTVSLTYRGQCHDYSVSHISGNVWTAIGGGFKADLSPGSKCISNIALPTGTLGTTVLAAGTTVTDDDFSNTYFTAGNGTNIVAIGGTCPAGNIQMSVNALATGTTLLRAYNLASGTGFGSFTFYGAMTTGSPCIAPVLPATSSSIAVTGFYVGDSAGAVSASAGAGVTLVPATGDCVGAGFAPYMLSEAAGSTATTGESLVILPPATTAGNRCSLGICFDGTGNAYSGAPTCPAGTAALTSATEVDVIPVSADCTEMWASESSNCASAFDTDGSIQAHCGGGPGHTVQTTANTPVAAVRTKAAHTNTGCAACFPSIPGGNPDDYSVNGCVGSGHVTCALLHPGNGTVGDSTNVIPAKQ